MTLPQLLCRIGWHAPIPGARWNAGYCFTQCSRCGRDMVRSAFGEWHVPKGFRVVWGQQPPAGLDSALEARYGIAPKEELNGAAPTSAPITAVQQQAPASNGAMAFGEPEVQPKVVIPPRRASPFDFEDFA
jgi:hypothetical protein